MVIVQATMWPQGNESGAYELLNATISNRTSPGDARESYMCHVTARPKPFAWISGYDADVEVKEHNAQDGFAPLLMAVLGAAHSPSGQGILLPPARTLARVELVSVDQFEKLLRSGRQ